MQLDSTNSLFVRTPKNMHYTMLNKELKMAIELQILTYKTLFLVSLMKPYLILSKEMALIILQFSI